MSQNIQKKKHSEFVDVETHPVYGQIFPNPDYLGLHRLGALIAKRTPIFIDSVSTILQKEDWIGLLFIFIFCFFIF